MEVRRSWTREDLRDSLYLGRVRPNDIPKKFNQVSRQRAQVLVTRIPPGLHFTNEDWSLLRAASELSGCSAFSRRLYTDAEMRNALKAVHGKELTQKETSARFGLKVATIQKYLTELRKMLHAGFTLERALLALNFPSSGPRRRRGRSLRRKGRRCSRPWKGIYKTSRIWRSQKVVPGIGRKGERPQEAGAPRECKMWKELEEAGVINSQYIFQESLGSFRAPSYS